MSEFIKGREPNSTLFFKLQIKARLFIESYSSSSSSVLVSYSICFCSVRFDSKSSNATTKGRGKSLKKFQTEKQKKKNCIWKNFSLTHSHTSSLRFRCSRSSIEEILLGSKSCRFFVFWLNRKSTLTSLLDLMRWELFTFSCARISFLFKSVSGD